jgi:hypothetical protein
MSGEWDAEVALAQRALTMEPPPRPDFSSALPRCRKECPHRVDTRFPVSPKCAITSISPPLLQLSDLRWDGDFELAPRVCLPLATAQALRESGELLHQDALLAMRDAWEAEDPEHRS